MLPYFFPILFLQHEQVDLFEITSTPELINYLDVKWMTLLRGVVGYEEEFTLTLDSILDEMLFFLKMNGTEMLRNHHNYMTSKGRGSKKQGSPGKNICELMHDFFSSLRCCLQSRIYYDAVRHHAMTHAYGVNKAGPQRR